jgi:hypothetical protein
MVKDLSFVKAALASAILTLALGPIVALTEPAVAGDAATFRVTFRNLTEGQPLTPPVAATHASRFHVFQFRREARYGVQQIAENGDNAPLLTFLGRRSRVFEAVQGGDGPLAPVGTPGGEMFPEHVSFEITAAGDARYLSLVSMLVCTNDGFTGVDSLRLPTSVGDRAVYEGVAYDARTEQNTQDLADIVPPCQELVGVHDNRGDPGTAMTDSTLRTNGVVRMHRGIVAERADLVPKVHGWADPVSRITVERTS